MWCALRVKVGEKEVRSCSHRGRGGAAHKDGGKEVEGDTCTRGGGRRRRRGEGRPGMPKSSSRRRPPTSR